MCFFDASLKSALLFFVFLLHEHLKGDEKHDTGNNDLTKVRGEPQVSREEQQLAAACGFKLVTALHESGLNKVLYMQSHDMAQLCSCEWNNVSLQFVFVF